MADNTENKTQTNETLTVFHGSSSFFSKPDLDKEETDVHGSGFYTTLDAKEAYNYAYANGGQNIQKDGDKNAIYRMEISREGMYDGYSTVKEDLYEKMQKQAQAEGNSGMLEHLATITPGQSKVNDLLKVGFDTGKTKADNDFFSRAGVNSVLYNGWVVAFNNNAIVESELAFASVKEGTVIPSEVMSKNTVTMTFSEENGTKRLSAPSQNNPRLDKMLTRLKEENPKLASDLLQVIATTPKTEYGTIAFVALSSELEEAMDGKIKDHSFPQTMDFYRTMGKKDLSEKMSKFLFDGLRSHLADKEAKTVVQDSPAIEKAPAPVAKEAITAHVITTAQAPAPRQVDSLFEKRARVKSAIEQGNLEALKNEFSNGADKELFARHNNAILSFAVHNNQYDRNEGILDFVLSNEYANVNEADRYGNTLGHEAILCNDPHALAKLQQAGLDMEARGEKDRTLSDLYKERYSFVPDYAKNGYDDVKGFDAFFPNVKEELAAKEKQTEAAAEAVEKEQAPTQTEKPDSLYEKDSDSKTLGHEAVYSEDPEALAKLQKAGLDMSVKDGQNRTIEDLYREREGYTGSHAKDGYGDVKGFNALFAEENAKAAHAAPVVEQVAPTPVAPAAPVVEQVATAPVAPAAPVAEQVAPTPVAPAAPVAEQVAQINAQEQEKSTKVPEKSFENLAAEQSKKQGGSFGKLGDMLAKDPTIVERMTEKFKSAYQSARESVMAYLRKGQSK